MKWGLTSEPTPLELKILLLHISRITSSPVFKKRGFHRCPLFVTWLHWTAFRSLSIGGKVVVVDELLVSLH